MKQQIGLGALVGLAVGLLCWSGNQTAQLVSTFPDAFTLVALAIMLATTIRFVLRRGKLSGRSTSLRAGVTVATAAGVVFGAFVVGLGFIRFTNPTPLLLAFGFLTALGSALACGVVATLVLEFARERAA